jgi:hypothetical protein
VSTFAFSAATAKKQQLWKSCRSISVYIRISMGGDLDKTNGKMLISTNATKEIMDVAEAFNWDRLSQKDLDTLLYALANYIKIRKL